MKPLRVMILSASVGAGHMTAAQSLVEAFQNQQPDAVVHLLDVFKMTTPLFGQIVTNTYIGVVSHYPSLYGFLYRMGNKKAGADVISGFINRQIAHYLWIQITQFQPDVIICTHASPAGAMANLKEEGKVRQPVFVVITDFTTHRLWLFPSLDGYIVAHDDVAQTLYQYGLPPRKVFVTGIPIRSSFRLMSAESKQELRSRLGFDNRSPLLLLMGGSAGVMPMQKVLDCLLQINRPLQLAIVAGKNQRLYTQLKRYQHQSSITVKLYQYVSNIHELMMAADLLISKPGGLTSSEALSCGLPIVIVQPIPGVEQGNTLFLIHHGAAVRVNIDQIPRMITQLLVDPSVLQIMGRQARQLGKPSAAGEIASLVINAVYTGIG